MFKKLLLLFAVSLFFTSSSFADKSDFFHFDEIEINAQLSQLDQLEDYVKAHKGVTYDEVKLMNADLVANVSRSSAVMDSEVVGGPLGIPAFVWGCLFGVFGLLIVYLFSMDDKHTERALLGCFINLAFIIAFTLAATLQIGSL